MNELDFYKITSTRNLDKGWLMTFVLNPNHRIFKGHFPGNPVLPGVCMVQMVKDILCNLTEKKWFLFEARQIKFLEMIIPNEKDVFSFSLNKDGNNVECLVRASFARDEKTLFKFQGRFKQV
jgi:3-hydroxyacyl-[acyl-carrier-protein] dehydratase